MEKNQIGTLSLQSMITPLLKVIESKIESGGYSIGDRNYDSIVIDNVEMAITFSDFIYSSINPRVMIFASYQELELSDSARKELMNRTLIQKKLV